MKQYAKRWLASILAVMMVIAVMPNYAFAVDDNDTSAGSTPTCVCETKCTDTQVNENCPICKDDITVCIGASSENSGGEANQLTEQKNPENESDDIDVPANNAPEERTENTQQELNNQILQNTPTLLNYNAEGEAAWGISENEEEPENWTYGTIEDAVAAANQTKGTLYIQLQKDIIGLDTCLKFTNSENTTVLDLNGYDIDRQLEEKVADGNIINIQAGNVILRDTNTQMRTRYGYWDENDEYQVQETKPEGIEDTEIEVLRGGMLTGGRNANANTTKPQIPQGNVGGGVYIYRGTFIMDGGNIIDNDGTNTSAAIYVYSGTLTINGGVIAGNGTGVALSSQFVAERYGEITFTLNDGRIVHNGTGMSVCTTENIDIDFQMNGGTVEYNNRGIYDWETRLYLEGGSISHNTKYETAAGAGVGDGAGIYAYGGSIYVTGTTKIQYNYADGDGGGIYGQYTTVHVEDNADISYNRADAIRSDSYGGGGICLVSANAFAYIGGGNIHDNYTPKNGGGIYIAGAVVYDWLSEWTGGTIENNVADQNGGGLYLGSAWNLSLEENEYNLEIAGTIIRGNEAAQNGGGVYVSEKSAILLQGSNAAQIEKNEAQNGGGIYVQGRVRLNQGTISGNTSTADGGGVYVEGALEFRDGVITGNQAQNGAGIANKGITTVEKGGQLYKNVATNGGNEFYNVQNGTATLFDPKEGEIAGAEYWFSDAPGARYADHQTDPTHPKYSAISTSDLIYLSFGNLVEVTFNSQGGSEISPLEVVKGSLVNKPADPKKTSFQFGGWYKEPECINKWDFTAERVSEDITLYAKWNSKQKLHFEANAGADTVTGIPSDIEEFPGEDVRIPATSKIKREGYTFNEWNTEPNRTGMAYDAYDDLNMPEEGITLYAQWLKDIKVIFDPQGGTAVEPFVMIPRPETDKNLRYISAFTSVAYKGCTRDGYIFNQWSVAPESKDSAYDYISVGPDSPDEITVYATWILDEPIIIHFNTLGGSPVPADQKVMLSDMAKDNVSIIKPVDPTLEAYQFEGWYYSPVELYETSRSQEMKDLAQQQIAEIKTQLEELEAKEEAGTITPSEKDALNELRAQYKAIYVAQIPEDQFASEMETLLLSSYYIENFSITLYANWSNNGSPLRPFVYDANGGENAPSGGLYAPESQVTVASEIPTRAGFEFTGWYLNPEGTGDKYEAGKTFLMPDKNLTLYAAWKEKTCTVTFFAGKQGVLQLNGVEDPDGSVSYSNMKYDDTLPESKIPEVTANTGYNFTNWLCTQGADDCINQIYTTDQIMSLTFAEDTVFVAQYEQKSSGGANHPEYTPDDDNDRDDEDDTEEVIEEEVPLAETPWLNTEDHYAYIVGYSEDGTVRPNANITRAEVATIFFRLLTDEARDQFWSTSNNFTDVAADAWYNNAISTMVNAGIIQGYEDGTFRPNNNITRAEFAAIASRFMSSGYDVEEDLFTDIANHWARDNINDAATAKWINGYPDGTFLPDKAITRAEAVTLVNNVLQRKPDADHMLDTMIKWPDNMDTSAWYYEAIQEATNSHDYDLFEGAEYETWTALQENRDWAALEKDWMNAHRGGGEVM